MKKLSHPVILIFTLATIGCLYLSCGKAAEADKTLLDMTYVYDSATIYWPTAKHFELNKLSWGINQQGRWYASNEYSASEHGGTHADAPIHFAPGGRTIDQIPLSEWIGPAVKIDVTTKCTADRDYRLAVSDILSWEERHGPIPENAWIVMYTGIGTRFYPEKSEVLGTEKTGEEALSELSFPGFSVDSVEFLLQERSIAGIALDTPSIDYGKSQNFEVHQVLFAGDKLALENIANLDLLPEAGAKLYVIPMLIKDGTGAPARVFAVF
jgi:kynurenine formamidase